MHVDLYTIDPVGQAHVKVATVAHDGHQFLVESDRAEIEKGVLARIEETRAGALDDLRQLFSAPELLATGPHDESGCPFSKSNRRPLDLHTPIHRYLVDQVGAAAESKLAALS